MGPFSAENSSSAATIQSSSGQISKAKDIAQYNVVSINKNASVYEAIHLMVVNDITGLPVVEGSRLVGIISEKDVLKLLYDVEFLAGPVGDYMTIDVLTFDEQDDLTDVCQCLIENKFRRVPILRDENLVAIITRADLIRANKYKFRPAVPHDTSTSHPNFLLAKHVMTCGLLTVRRNTPVYTAMELIASGNITGLPVVDDSMKLVGIVSEKDLLILLCDPNAKPGLVQDYMTRDTVSFDFDDSLFEVCHTLINNNFRRVPILNKGRLTGIISRRDIIIYIMENRAHFFSKKPKQ
ncbi:MAG: CBS domain-containing protein [Planctomycetota bacterium]